MLALRDPKRHGGTFRVDGLGHCLRTPAKQIPEKITLGFAGIGNTEKNLRLKRKAIGRYMFYMALENTLEPGYVSEKLFDALAAGTVPGQSV